MGSGCRPAVMVSVLPLMPRLTSSFATPGTSATTRKWSLYCDESIRQAQHEHGQNHHSDARTSITSTRILYGFSEWESVSEGKPMTSDGNACSSAAGSSVCVG